MNYENFILSKFWGDDVLNNSTLIKEINVLFMNGVDSIYELFFYFYYNYSLDIDVFFKSASTFLIISGIITGGVFTALYIVGTYIYYSLLISNTSLPFENLIGYEFKYIEEFDNLDDVELSKSELEALKNTTVKEETPRGEVLISYNSNLETFIYYANSKDIPYKYLETVSRYYVCQNNCKGIYVDYISELNKAQQKNIDIKKKLLEKKESENVVIKSSVFAPFKKHDKVGTQSSVVIPEKCNKYIYKGTLIDYTEKMRKSSDETEKSISFSEFKKLKKT